VTVFTSRDVSAPRRRRSGNDPATTVAAHGAVWDELWRDCDVVIEGDVTAQLAVRYNLFQLLAAAPRHDNRVSIPAKTLSGFAYRGHVFWDTEIFIVPFLTFTQPQVARNLLSYRYHTLDGARRKASEAGYEGRCSLGRCQHRRRSHSRWVPSPDGKPIRIWCGDMNSINADIAYAIWHYWQQLGMMSGCNERVEIILETAVLGQSASSGMPNATVMKSVTSR